MSDYNIELEEVEEEFDEEEEFEEQEFRVIVEYIGEEDYEDLAEDDHMCCDSHFYTGTDEDDVLDKFHDDHPCGNLELYEITVEPCDDEWDDEEEEAGLFINHYNCPECETAWSHTMHGTGDDKCPVCNLGVSPRTSEDATA